MSRDQDFVIEHIKRLGCHTMTDIVERLRFLKAEIEELVGQDIEEIEEAAAEIERLKIENNHRVCKLLAQIVAMRDEIERLRLRVKFLEDEFKCPAEPKP